MKRNLEIVIALLVISAAGCDRVLGLQDLNIGDTAGSDTEIDTGTGSEESECNDEETACLNGNYYGCIDGQWELIEECEAECYAPMGCVECIPGQTFCEGDIVMQCDSTGTEYVQETDCAELDTYCENGECFFGDPCEKAMVMKSSIGCEYWAADLDNAESAFDSAAAGQFAVAVANIGNDGEAFVEVHINNAPQGQPLDLELVESRSIPEKELYTFLLPRRDVDGENITDGVDDGPQTWLSSRAFRIRSNLPVVAYQFNTLDQKYSNDASLLIPTEGLARDYLVLGYPPSMPQTGPSAPRNRAYITLLGVEDDTAVTVTVTAAIEAGQGVDEIPEGGSATFTIGPFDVLNLQTKLYTMMEIMSDNPSVDLSGSTVISDKPVAVFFGTDLARITSTSGDDSCCADHLEQQVLPSKAMGQQFVVTRSAVRSTSGPPESDYYRIMSYTPATVHTSLPPPNDQFTLAPRQFHEFFVNTGFTVNTDNGYLHVAQFLTAGTYADPPIGDPSLLYVPAVEQRRALYIFTTGQGFSRNHAVISAPQNTPLTIDGLDVATHCDGPFSDGSLTIDDEVIDFESWDCEIEDGAHMVHSGSSPEEATVPIGVMVYGYYHAGSYSYPAGCNLRHSNPQVPFQ